MQGNFFQVKKINDDTLKYCQKYVNGSIKTLVDQGKVAAVKVEEYKPPRSLSANALYWMWLGEISKYLTAHGHKADKDDLHRLMKHKFLGYEDSRKIGKTFVEATLKSSKKLKRNEFCYYMEQVEAWAADMGCLVTSPIESEYKQFLQKQEAT